MSAEGAKNVSWPWLCPLRVWGSVTMTSTGKFVYIERETERETERQRERQRETERETPRETERDRERQIERPNRFPSRIGVTSDIRTSRVYLALKTIWSNCN